MFQKQKPLITDIAREKERLPQCDEKIHTCEVQYTVLRITGLSIGLNQPWGFAMTMSSPSPRGYVVRLWICLLPIGMWVPIGVLILH